MPFVYHMPQRNFLYYNKKLIILIIALLLCTSLISCGYRDTHVRHTGECTLKLKGNTYTQLGPDDPYVSVYPSFSTQVYVTENGVPGFLSRILHDDLKGMSSRKEIL